MGKTKPNKQNSKKEEKSTLNHVSASPGKGSSPPEDHIALLAQAAYLLQQGDIEGALTPAKKSLRIVDKNDELDDEDALPALNLLGEIHVELGDIDTARQYFLRAAQIDEDGEVDEDLGGGAEKFLWLAQLSEEGGRDSVGWFEKGARTLRTEIQELQQLVDSGKLKQFKSEEIETVLDEKRRKLATALSGVVEVYMTDLSWEEDAEQKCEALVTEATMVAPKFAEPWQTLASVRISQERKDDARAALRRSMDLWKDLPPEDEAVPDFATRVSLARLLMEADMEEDAIEVLERLVSEDDSSVEVWYLGGWGLYIMGEKQKEANGKKSANADGENYKISWISSRQWLNHSLRLFEMQDYEDDRLGDHAKELIILLDKDLGGPATDADEEEDDEDEGSEDDSDEDEEMTGV
jgi:tetratricopeptide (TPR) repeat protein